MKTSLGLTDRFEINEKVLQGDVFGNILASNQIDSFGKHCLENQEHIYMYRDKIPIAPFTMCDDLFTVSECGYQTELMAAYINSQSRYNFLQFGLSKCFKLHVGKYKEKFKCQPVLLDSWTSEEVEDKKTGQIYFQEDYKGKVQIKEVNNEKYLGNKISADGTNKIDLTAKCNRGIGIVNKIETILETRFFGKYYFEVGKTLIESMLLGSILNNIEVAYNLTKSDIEQLQKCHEMGLRKLLSLPSKTPKKMLYLLTGSVPIEFLIERRRLIYLHHILNQENESLIKTFFEHQLDTRKTKYWASQILKDLKKFNVNIPLEDIRHIPKEAWKKRIKQKSCELALLCLNSNQGSKSHQKEYLEMSPYLRSNKEDIPIKASSFIAKVQAHMVKNIKHNFKEHYKPNLKCDSCKLSECDQKHLLECPKLIGKNELVTYIPNYIDIFNDNDITEQGYKPT